jgi:hypothetical protein
MLSYIPILLILVCHNITDETQTCLSQLKSGLSHAAYTLRNESHLDKTAFRDITLPRGELLTLLRKALLYSEVEVHWNKVSHSVLSAVSLLNSPNRTRRLDLVRHHFP